MASYQKAADNSWSVRFRIIDTDGKTIQKRLSSFNRKSDAERAYREFMASYVAPEPLKCDESLTFNQFLNQFLQYKSARIKPSSLYDITNVIKKRILPYFDKKRVIKITKIDVLNWQAKLDVLGFSYKYKSNLRGHLSSIFNYGLRYCDLPSNPVQMVEPFRNTEKKKEMQIWSEDEFLCFIGAITNPMHKTFFAMLYFSGCRKGEMLAIGWDDINFNTGILTINKSITRKVEGKAFAYSTCKNTSSDRRLRLPGNCLQLLSELKNISNPKLPFVFGGAKPLAENTITRVFDSYCAESGVKRIRLHDLRHSHASLLISKGENIVMVAKRLGHSNIEQTLNTYSHLMPNAEGEMVSKINLKF